MDVAVLRTASGACFLSPRQNGRVFPKHSRLHTQTFNWSRFQFFEEEKKIVVELSLVQKRKQCVERTARVRSLTRMLSFAEVHCCAAVLLLRLFDGAMATIVLVCWCGIGVSIQIQRLHMG